MESATLHLARHFVALKVNYESLNEDGSVFHTGQTLFSGFVVEICNLHFWVTAGHCLKDELDEPIAKHKLRVTGGGYLDYCGSQAKYKFEYPFFYETECSYFVEDRDAGLDYALIRLDGLQIAAFEKNGVIPIRRRHWENQPTSYDLYNILGIPSASVMKSDSNEAEVFALRRFQVNRIRNDELGECPSGTSKPSDVWFMGRVHPDVANFDLAGVSGGPVFGFLINESGDSKYQVVALQSRWWPNSRTVFGCSLPYFAEQVYQKLQTLAGS